jgi:hypothetical protein
MASQPKNTRNESTPNNSVPALPIQNISDIADQRGSVAGPSHAADDIGSDNESFGRTDNSRTPGSPQAEDDDPLDLITSTGQEITPDRLRRADSTEQKTDVPDPLAEHAKGPMMRLTGFEAIEYAEKQNLRLNKHPDSITGSRVGLSVAEAEAIADDDPDLIWVDVSKEEYFTGPPWSFEPDY